MLPGQDREEATELDHTPRENADDYCEQGMVVYTYNPSTWIESCRPAWVTQQDPVSKKKKKKRKGCGATQWF
jgi:hypothetical protein